MRFGHLWDKKIGEISMQMNLLVHTKHEDISVFWQDHYRKSTSRSSQQPGSMLLYPVEVTSLFSHSNANAVSPWTDYFFVARMATMHGSNLYQDDFRYCYWQTPNSSVAAHSVWSHLSRTLARQLVRGWLYHNPSALQGTEILLYWNLHLQSLLLAAQPPAGSWNTWFANEDPL